MPDIDTAPKIVRCYQEDGAFADHQHSRVAIADGHDNKDVRLNTGLPSPILHCMI